eukprot:547084-Alexandrium_andersonii.AAC.1
MFFPLLRGASVAEVVMASRARSSKPFPARDWSRSAPRGRGASDLGSSYGRPPGDLVPEWLSRHGPYVG